MSVNNEQGMCQGARPSAGQNIPQIWAGAPFSGTPSRGIPTTGVDFSPHRTPRGWMKNVFKRIGLGLAVVVVLVFLLDSFGAYFLDGPLGPIPGEP